MTRKELFSWYGTVANTALSQAANAEVEDMGTEVCEWITELGHSPMYRLLVKAYKESLNKAILNDPEFTLTTFAARVFAAGIREGERRAAGK